MASLSSSRFSYFSPSGDNNIYNRDDVKKEIQEPLEKYSASARKMLSISETEQNKDAVKILTDLVNVIDVALNAAPKAKSEQEAKSGQEERPAQTKPNF